MSRRLPTHNPLDCSVVNLDSEDLDVNFYRLSDDLEKDLRDHDMSWLTLHYPEYDFQWIPRKPGGQSPKGHELKSGRRGGWIVADFKH